MRVAIDTGGTFTDCVYLRDGKLQVLKVFSTPADPGLAVVEALREIGAPERVVVRHGTTVGTNAMLERKGARVAFVTTAGFEDVIAIGRQARAKLYDWFQAAPDCLAPAELRFGVEERTTAEGLQLKSAESAALSQLAERIRTSDAESIAISLLFSFANPSNESMVQAALAEIGIPVSVSHLILPEFREYERASTVVANAYLSRIVGGYMEKLVTCVGTEFDGRVEVMQSSGGIIPARIAAQEPVRTLLSGPAGGVMGAYQMAKLAGFDRIIGFDMGGTSTDVSLVDATLGGPQLSTESNVSGMPIGIPMLDIHTAGAGGSSLARFDSGGLLHVGPESAGSSPGPICFGHGEQPTVTDANLILGRLDSTSFLGGAVPLDRERTVRLMELAKGSIGSVDEFAAGIIRVVEASMEKAIRVISIERGYDPRDFTLVAFGGGGPLHACALAHALRIPRVLIPALPGALSAVGILLADSVRDYSRTVMLPSDANLESLLLELEERGNADFKAEELDGLSMRSVDLRYRGQGYELNVPFGEEMLTAFHQLHRKRYGFANEQREVEIVNVRVRMIAKTAPFKPIKKEMREGNGEQAKLLTRAVQFDGRLLDTPVYVRNALRPGDAILGPAIITEYSSATILPPEDSLSVDALDNLIIEVHA
ncbi:MAG: hydantoinase/oxoprolinase family protein [Terracidiphilus sp.]|jgi:N-methylhydantoinase A